MFYDVPDLMSRKQAPSTMDLQNEGGNGSDTGIQMTERPVPEPEGKDMNISIYGSQPNAGVLYFRKGLFIGKNLNPTPPLTEGIVLQNLYVP